MSPEELKAAGEKAQEIIRKNAAISAGLGLIPVPLLDVAALTTQQLYMIKNLGELYGQDFRHQLGRKAVVALVGSVIPQSSWRFTLYGAIKLIPLIGTPISMLTQPILASAMTYAVGEVFNKHFASGGTFLSFDPVKQADFFEERLRARGVNIPEPPVAQAPDAMKTVADEAAGSTSYRRRSAGGR